MYSGTKYIPENDDTSLTRTPFVSPSKISCLQSAVQPLKYGHLAKTFFCPISAQIRGVPLYLTCVGPRGIQHESFQDCR